MLGLFRSFWQDLIKKSSRQVHLIQSSLPLFLGAETEADSSHLEVVEEARGHPTPLNSCNMAGFSVDCAKPQGAQSVL